MGERFLRKQAHGFRHRFDAAFDRMLIPNLIAATKPEVMARDIRCECCGSNSIPGCGDAVMLQRDGQDVRVLHGPRVVGLVPVDELASITPALDLGCGVLRARIRSVSAISPAFVVRLEASP